MLQPATLTESLRPALMPGPASRSELQLCWHKVMTELDGLLTSRQAHAARTVVLVPYAQLMQEARAAWAEYAASAVRVATFVPRFETTMNWANSLGPSSTEGMPAADDLQLDAAVDALTAASLLERAGLAHQRSVLVGRLVEAAWSLASLAASQVPEHRIAWGARQAARLVASLEAPALALELAVARIAIAWAAASSYPSDVLFSAPVEKSLDLLVVIEGFQTEPLAGALTQHFGSRAAALSLHQPAQAGALSLHAAQDAEDEAQRAAACVMQHLVAGRSPVALIAQDRVLTRRTRAMLAGRGVALRDETGWKLSTTRAAATLMGLLRALPWDASSDAVLDWLKNAPAFDEGAVVRAETILRKTGIRLWRGVPASTDLPTDLQLIADQAAPLRQALQRARGLREWLNDLRLALQSAGQWDAFATDPAGIAVLKALRMQPGDERMLPLGLRMSLPEFTQWVSQTLEAATFSPVHPPQAQVVILPLSQLLGRSIRAVVLPGCDEVRLPVSPEPPGMWTPAMRALLGLPSRAELATAQRQAWQYALHLPAVDVLWRSGEAGERLMPSGFVQELLLQHAKSGTSGWSPDPRTRRMIALHPTLRPQPTADALSVERLSASAYEDLRRCPYRFFALRQLRLSEADELESELDKRDFGNWLHTLLYSFHQALNLALKEAVALDLSTRVAMINIAAEKATVELGLSESEFLPFAAIWPRVRAGYLEWLAAHEASGARFVAGEDWKEMPLGSVKLIGKIDRIDQMPDGSRIVLDYKTEARSTTQARISDPQEDTQLTFYAALLDDDTLAAAYVNIGEKEATRAYHQPDIVDLRDQLIASVVSDMARIAAAAPLPALGEGKACEYCAARGLCRKDFWNA